jgi:hypothetical protein
MKTTTYLEGPFTCQITSGIYNIPRTESEEIIIIEHIFSDPDNKAIYSTLDHKTLEH